VTSARRYVIVGLSRVGVRVARRLAGEGAEVAVIAWEGERDLAPLLNGTAKVIDGMADVEGCLREAGLPGSECLLVLSEDDMANLNAAVTSGAVAPEVPVVLRAFDPSLADQLGGLGIRRAFSVSALAAPAFVAAALADEVAETLRLGADEVTLLRLTVRAGSPLIGRTAAEVKQETGCAAIARASHDAPREWRPIGLEERIGGDGDRVLAGGLLKPVLALAMWNGGVADGRATRRSWRSTLRRPPRTAASGRVVTLLPASAAVLVVLLLASVAVFGVTLHLGPIDAMYFSVSTALGNSTLDASKDWLKVVGVATMLLGGALLGVLFSWLASVATAQRLEQRMGRRARELSGHAVLVGLGTIGYRVEQLLHQLGVPTVVLDRDPDPRFAGIVADRAPVLTGDVRLPENLDRAGVREARWFIACTPDDLTNIEACLSARRLHPGIRTVARIFDADLAERVGGALGVDAAVSASAVAARAFAGAATDERAFRPFRVGDADYLAFRFDPPRPVDMAEIDHWRTNHVRILAFMRAGGAARPPSELTGGLSQGDSAIVAGPAEHVRSLVPGQDPSKPRFDTLGAG
jgi:Trk K+ transport system NAD-binding subunit